VKTLEEIPMLAGARPVLGHLGALRRQRLEFVTSWATDVERIARFSSPVAPGFIVNHPEVLSELLVEKARAFEKSLMTRFSLGPLAGEGLFTSRYDLWKKQRKLMAPLFQPAQLRRYANDMIACTERGIAEWRDGETRELLRETTRMTMSIAGKTLFDADTFSEADSLGAALTASFDWAADNAPSPLAVGHLALRQLLIKAGKPELGAKFERPVFLFGERGRKLKEAIALLDDRVQRMIDERRAHAMQTDTQRDLLSKLLAARDQDDGSTMTDKQVRDEVLTLFTAGHETTATALAWSIYCLCRHPAIYEAMQREVDALPGEPTIEDLPRLDLTLRVFKETLRLYPPAFLLARQAHEAVSLDDVMIPVGAIVLFAPYALHRKADLWPDPERFDPDRFLARAESARHRLSWLPFGAGPRVCIGNHFAMMEAQLVLAKLLRSAEFELVGEEAPLPLATLRPKYGMRVRIRLRRPRENAKAPSPPLDRTSAGA
jgi:cytochrome P450